MASDGPITSWQMETMTDIIFLGSKITAGGDLFSRSVVSESLTPHELQHSRPLCPSPTPRVYSNSCALSQWCHQTISSSVVPFSSCLQSFPASGSFQVSQLFTSGGQSTGVSISASVLPMNTQDWSPCSPRDSQESSPHHIWKASILLRSVFFTVQPSHPYVTTGKTIALTRQTSSLETLSPDVSH